MTKEEIRKTMRKVREQMSVMQTTELSVRICEKVLALPEFKTAKRVMSYASLKGEVQTAVLNAYILEAGKELYLPAAYEEGHMDAVQVTTLEGVTSAHGLYKPTGARQAPEKIDLVIVPGVAFDLKGGRVGFGVGYYDRFLPQTRATRVAVAFSTQVVEDAMSTEHDQPMDLLITENAAHNFRK